MCFFFSLFAYSTDSISLEVPDAQDFTPDLLFIHELWLHPEDPSPRGDVNVPLNSHTRSHDDVCSWYGNFSDSEIQSTNDPYGLKSRLRAPQSDYPKECAAQSCFTYHELGSFPFCMVLV